MAALLGVWLSTTVLFSQSPDRDNYWNASKIQHGDGAATVSADDPRPLWMALNALRREYGWAVSYEEPVYDITETALAHNPQWDTKHPEKPSRFPAGASFAARYNEDANTANSPVQRLAVVRQVVSSYNDSGNPGSFAVKVLSNGQVDVVGQSRVAGKAAKSILDTEINLGAGYISSAKALSAMVDALSSASDVTVAIGKIPLNLIVGPQINLPAGNASARSILLLIADSARVPMDWELLYDWDSNRFVLSMEPQSKLATDRMGNQVIRWIPKGADH